MIILPVHINPQRKKTVFQKKNKYFYCLKFNENKWLTLLAQTKEDRCISDVLHIPKGPTTAFHSIKSI